MTEAEWLSGTHLVHMLHFARLHFIQPREIGDRKLRLFAVACCRLIVHALSNARSRSAVDVAEQAAEGAAGGEELRAAHENAMAAADTFGPRTKTAGAPSRVAEFAVEANPIDAAKRVANWIHSALVTAAAPPGTYWPTDLEEQVSALRELAGDVELKARVAAAQALIPKLLQDVCGNPFRLITTDAKWLAWNDGVVGKLAHVIYDERAFDRLPLLADALEGAGCTDADILAHCHGPGPHVRGCWVVDLLTGKA